MGLRLFNSLTHQVDDFSPLAPPRVTLYTCGPTVWNFAHIGNFRTFIFEDLLRRYLEFSGYEVFHMMNLTDVDDRTIEKAAEAGLNLRDHTKPFVDAFFEDRDYLRIEPAHVYPRATEYVAPMVELVEDLLEKGIAYKADDGSVYFAVDKFPEYGRLSQLEGRELKSGARVDSDEYDKADVRDFALWKGTSPVDEQVEAAWDSSFGRGRPGWHLECSAMALSEIKGRFGVETVDIHAGGVDLIFPHHENEIAQSEAATGEPFARFWVHGEFLNMKGTKMSKRYGNVLTPRDLREQNVEAEAIRMLLFSTHYRQQFNFTDEALQSARDGVVRLGEFRRRLADFADPDGSDRVELAAQLERDVKAALDDDLNAPKAVAGIFGFVRWMHRALDAKELTPSQAGAALRVFDVVTDILQLVPPDKQADSDLTAWVEAQIEARQEARKAKDFAEADRIRDAIAARGVELEDTPEGPRWKLSADSA
jgi:cysteinyl-tRNA synthetase